MQCHINRETAKVSELSSCKIDKYGYFTVKDILTSYQRQITPQTQFTCSKVFEIQRKTNEDAAD